MSGSTSATITTYFEKILFRTPSAAEVSAWAGPVGAGTLTLEQVRTSLINSTETTNFVDPVFRLYQSAFGRVPESDAAVRFYADLLRGGQATVTSLANNFSASPEFVARYGSAGPNAAYVTALYVNVLGRTPAASEVDWYLASGMTTSQMLQGFSQSPEFQTRSGPAVDAFLNSNALGTASFTGPLQIVTAGQTFTLTNSQDTLTGTAGNDTFNAGVAIAADGTTEVQTLQSFDTINGGNGIDTLNVTLNGTAVTPVLSSVENVSVRAVKDTTLALGSSTGVTTVTVENSTAVATVTGVGNAALVVANQVKNAAFDGSTATNLSLTVNAVGKSDALNVIDLGTATAAKATSAAITLTNAHVDINSTQADVLTSASIAATGTNTLKFTDSAATLTSLTVTGAGSVNVSGQALVKVATLTVGDGGITFTNGDSTATTFSATTGAGKDTLTVDGANVKSISTGAGNDSVTTAVAALAATATVDLGAGDDTLTLHAAPTAGATLTGGEGKDTIVLAAADYGTISGFAAANLAKITGFEVLSITDVLADAANINLSKISGVTSFQTVGVETGKAATVSDVGANSSVVLKGDLKTNDGALTVTLKDATGSSDVLNVTINTRITQNNDGTVDTFSPTVKLTANGVETLNVVSTGFLSTEVTAGSKTDVASNTLTLTNNNLTTLNITGDQAFSFTAAAGMTKLATVDASGLTAGGATINVGDVTAADAIVVKITGSAGADVITGGAKADVINAGAGNDVVTGGLGADNITLGAGNDTAAYTAVAQSTLANLDIITDFQANTVGATTTNIVRAIATVADRNGDVLRFDVDTGILSGGTRVSIQSNAADATTAVANIASETADLFIAVLDSSTGRLYTDWDSDGVVDSVIQLTGVTTITAAAFELV